MKNLCLALSVFALIAAVGCGGGQQSSKPLGNPTTPSTGEMMHGAAHAAHEEPAAAAADAAPADGTEAAPAKADDGAAAPAEPAKEE